MAKETAEQKLLKLIEATEAQDPSSAPTATPDIATVPEAQQVLDSVKNVGVSTVKIPPFVANLLKFFANPTSLFQPGVFGLKSLNILLLVLIVIIGILFIFSFSSNLKHSQKNIIFESPEGVVIGGGDLFPTFKKLSDYVQVISRRNIFQPWEEKIEEEVIELPIELQGLDAIISRTEDLKLVGISWLDTPDTASAMIENTVSGVTYFLQIGEKIKGVDVMVEAIYADSIVVSFNGEEMEMKL